MKMKMASYSIGGFVALHGAALEAHIAGVAAFDACIDSVPALAERWLPELYASAPNYALSDLASLVSPRPLLKTRC
jgi:hypothetical protein